MSAAKANPVEQEMNDHFKEWKQNIGHCMVEDLEMADFVLLRKRILRIFASHVRKWTLNGETPNALEVGDLSKETRHWSFDEDLQEALKNAREEVKDDNF